MPTDSEKVDAAREIVDDYFLVREILYKLEKRRPRGMNSDNIDTVAALLLPEMSRRAGS